MRVDATKETFEAVTVLGKPMLFTCLRVDRKTIPEGMFLYEVRYDDDGCCDPVQIAKWVMVNHLGTLLSNTEIPLEQSFNGSNAYHDIDPERDWSYEGHPMTLAEYMEVN